MSAVTEIAWTDRTWNCVRGCSRVSLGCGGPGRVGGCYAERQAHRFNYPGGPYEGLTRMTENGPRWTGVVRLIPEALDEPLRWRKPQRVFANSMSDLFHESLPDVSIAAVFGAMAACLHHTFQVLTKRPERMRRWFEWYETDHVEGRYRHPELIEHAAATAGSDRLYRAANEAAGRNTWPLPNVWLGCSVEDQATADERIPLLLQTPAAKRFVSYEPALGPVDFWDALGIYGHDGPPCCTEKTGWHRKSDAYPRVDWLIVGGESGPGARPFDAAWARSTVAQCRAAGVACFVKQMGRWVIGDDRGFRANHYLLPDGVGFVPPMIGPQAFRRPAEAIGFSLCDPKGGDPEAWPADLRVREFPA